MHDEFTKPQRHVLDSDSYLYSETPVEFIHGDPAALLLTYVPFSPTVFPFLIGFSGIPEMFKSNTRAQTSTATRR